MYLVIEALHQHSMLGKEDLDGGRSYSDMLGSLVEIEDFENIDQ